MTLYIRPTFIGDNPRPASFALCRHNVEILTDREIVDHFETPADARQWGEQDLESRVLWGEAIFND